MVILTVEVFEGRKLENKSGTIGKSDAYVELVLGSDSLLTEIRHSAGCAPKWNETFKFMTGNDTKEELLLSAYDYKRNFKEELIGQISLPLPDPKTASVAKSEWYDIRSETGRVTGQIQLAIYYDEDFLLDAYPSP